MHQVTPSKKKIILIVEDDLSIRETLGYTLELEGYPVVTCSNGKRAYEYLLQNDPPGLILLDLMMPEMNGIELWELMQKDPKLKSIPVIAVTAISNHVEMTKQTRGVIRKPIHLDELFKQVEKNYAG